MQDIIDQLVADHKEVTAMLKKLTADELPDDAEAIFARLYASRTAHARFEEEEVYPLLKDEEETKDLALEAYEEHKQALILLEAINDLDDEDETCAAKTNVLSENLHHHIREEESELLPELKKQVPAATLQELGARYQRIRGEAEDGSEPAAGSRTAPGKASPAAKKHQAGRAQ